MGTYVSTTTQAEFFLIDWLQFFIVKFFAKTGVGATTRQVLIALPKYSTDVVDFMASALEFFFHLFRVIRLRQMFRIRIHGDL